VSTDIDGAGIDKVLRDAVDSGAVPHVAAVAADRTGSSTPARRDRARWARTHP
jgi:hypothetical protein